MSDEVELRSWRAADGVVHGGQVVCARGGFDVVDCEHCGFRHVLPLPTPEQLRDAYAHDYYATEKPLYIERYLEDIEWWQAVYRARYETLEANLDAGRRRVLDVGSGPGIFLAAGRDRGWDARGIEPSRQAARYSREQLGLDVTEAFLDAGTAAGLGSFDAINLSLVLEHLPDPAGMLSLVRGMLAPGGMVCLVAPNDFNPFQETLRDQCGYEPWWVAPPHHLNYFDFQSLSRLVRRCGFEVVRTEATFPIDMFLLMGNNYIGDDAVGRACHRQRMAFELNLARSGKGALLSALQGKFAELGIGREIVLFARKGRDAVDLE